MTLILLILSLMTPLIPTVLVEVALELAREGALGSYSLTQRQ
jgi:hypothetical protein